MQYFIFVASSHTRKVRESLPLQIIFVRSIQLLHVTDIVYMQWNWPTKYGQGWHLWNILLFHCGKSLPDTVFAQIIAFRRIFNKAHPLLTDIPIPPTPHPLPPLCTNCCLSWILGPSSCKSRFGACELKQRNCSHNFVSLLCVVAWKASSEMVNFDQISLAWEEEKKQRSHF